MKGKIKLLRLESTLPLVSRRPDLARKSLLLPARDEKGAPLGGRRSVEDLVFDGMARGVVIVPDIGDDILVPWHRISMVEVEKDMAVVAPEPPVTGFSEKKRGRPPVKKKD